MISDMEMVNWALPVIFSTICFRGCRKTSFQDGDGLKRGQAPALDRRRQDPDAQATPKAAQIAGLFKNMVPDDLP